MKVYYVNDESIAVSIRVLGKDMNESFTLLLPQEGKIFEFEAPTDAVPYIKRWNNNMILISYADASVAKSVADFDKD